MFDDTYAEIGYLDSIRLRNSYNQYGLPVNFAIIMNFYNNLPNKLEIVNKFLTIRLNGSDLVNHSYKHDVPMPRKNSLVLNYELTLTQQMANEMHVFPDMFVYNWSGTYIPTFQLLESKGFNCAVHSSGNTSNLMTNKFNLKRVNISDSTTYSYVSNLFL